MTIYEFILKHSKHGQELFSDIAQILALRKMTEEERITYLKQYDKSKKPKRKRAKKVDKPTNNKYTDKTNGGKSEAKSVPRKRKRKATSESA